MIDLEKMTPYVGRPIRLHVEDVSGGDVAPEQSRTLRRIERTEDGFVKFYVSESEFLAAPVFAGDPESGFFAEDGKPMFISHDRKAELVYRVRFL